MFPCAASGGTASFCCLGRRPKGVPSGGTLYSCANKVRLNSAAAARRLAAKLTSGATWRLQAAPAPVRVPCSFIIQPWLFVQVCQVSPREGPLPASHPAPRGDSGEFRYVRRLPLYARQLSLTRPHRTISHLATIRNEWRTSMRDATNGDDARLLKNLLFF